MNLVECLKCGHLQFTVSAQYVKNWESEWVTYWKYLDAEAKQNFGVSDGPPRVDQYLKCFKCGIDYTNFKESEGGTSGVFTVQAILDRREKL